MEYKYNMALDTFTQMEIQIDCSLHMGIPMGYVCWYIPKAMRTIPILPGTIHDVHYTGYIDGLCPFASS